LVFFVAGVVEVNKLVEIGLHFSLVDVPLAVHLHCCFVTLLFGKLSIDIAATFFDVFYRDLLRA